MKVSIVGGGYVGLVSGACLAEQGHSVTVVDKDASRVAQIEAGQAPFFEPGLDELLAKTVGSKLYATTDLDKAVTDTELTIIAVGTPSMEDGSVDLTAIESVSKQIGQAIAKKSAQHVVVVKSTVPPGTTRDVVGRTLEKYSGREPGVDFGLGMNPEFLTEGTAVCDFRSPDRIVIGGEDDLAISAQQALYAGFENVPVLSTNCSTAEMIKYMSNALLATMISFANEFADYCEAVGNVDVVEVQKGVHLSRYLTSRESETAPISSFIEAGCGFGGSCLPKDVKGLVRIGERNGRPMRLLKSVLEVNAERPGRVIDLLNRNLPEVRGAKIAVLGLSFRPDTDDMRESPALPIIESLVTMGCRVSAYDPQAMPAARPLLSAQVSLEDSIKTCVEDADAVVIVTRWSEFAELPEVLDCLGQNPVVIDGRRMLDKNRLSNYAGVGI